MRVADECHSLSFSRALNGLPSVLKDFFTVLSAATGWSFMVLMGGLLPHIDGEITTMRFELFYRSSSGHGSPSS
jgi:hypothetical protein